MQIPYTVVPSYTNVAKLNIPGSDFLRFAFNDGLKDFDWGDMYSTPLGLLGYTTTQNQGLILLENACDAIRRDLPRDIRQHQTCPVLFSRRRIDSVEGLLGSFFQKGDTVNILQKQKLDYVFLSLSALDRGLQQTYNVKYTFDDWNSMSPRDLLLEEIKKKRKASGSAKNSACFHRRKVITQ